MSSDDEWGQSPPRGEVLFGYPADYRDPESDGTEAQFRDRVLPARAAALGRSLDQALADARHPELRFQWGPLAPAGILGYDLPVPRPWPVTVEHWQPMRNVFSSRSQCYRLRSGSRVHVKPECRCPRS